VRGVITTKKRIEKVMEDLKTSPPREAPTSIPKIIINDDDIIIQAIKSIINIKYKNQSY
jgi:hypothetical protein